MIRTFVKHSLIFNLSLFVGLGMATCSTRNSIPIKEAPEHKAEITDTQLKAAMEEYFKLSAQYHIAFKKNVTSGFKDIDKGNVIGMCTYSDDWREIDYDNQYWQGSSWLSKLILVFHEMTHCYCTRKHDFAAGKYYPDDIIGKILEGIVVATPVCDKPDGFFDDGCAITIMHPTIQSDYCIQKHYDHYVKEMFERCEPW